MARSLVTEIERSLAQQENYLDFRTRMLDAAGVQQQKGGAGVLEKWRRAATTEARLAWNEALVIQGRATHGDDEVWLVWRAMLDERTTEGCWANHGELIDVLGDTPPAHWLCRCSVLTIPATPEGQAMIDAILNPAAPGED